MSALDAHKPILFSGMIHRNSSKHCTFAFLRILFQHFLLVPILEAIEVILMLLLVCSLIEATSEFREPTHRGVIQ